PVQPLADARQNTGAAERRFTDARVADGQDERLAVEALEDGANLRVTSEEEPAVLGLEGLEATERVALGHHLGARFGGELRERGAHFVARRVTKRRIAREAARHDGGEPRIDPGHHVAERTRIARERRASELLHLLAVVRRPSGAEREEERAERVHVGSKRRLLAAPHLGGD